MQTLSDYVYNFGDSPKYNQWASRCVALENSQPEWRDDQIEALAFKEVFPELTLPPQFEPKP